MQLTAENVTQVMLQSLFDKNEIHGDIPPNAVIVEGIMTRYGFNPERLEQNRQNVYDMLSELPDNFFVGKGGGWSFLNACMTKSGEQWGEHHHMEGLFCLGIGLRQVKWLMKEMCGSLPGGMPYVQVSDTAAGFPLPSGPVASAGTGAPKNSGE